MKLDTKITCQFCGKTTDRIATHEKCLYQAATLATIDDPGSVYNSQIVRKFTEDCYLCGKPLGDGPTHADHVHPRDAGGSDHWSNIGATHETCNLSKQAKIGITDEQQERLDTQHERLREAASHLDDGIWFQMIVGMIDEAEQIDDPEMLREDMDDWFEDDPSAPEQSAIDAFFVMIKNPDQPRDTVSQERLGMVIDEWRNQNAAADAEWDAKYGDRDPRELAAELLESLRPRVVTPDAPPESPKRSRGFRFFKRS